MIRHGETVANAEGYAAGSFDTPLTDKGREQAQAACRSLECLSLKPKLIVHSHLSRARDTANILNKKLHLPMQENVLLSEQCFGDWMGTSWDTVRERIEAGKIPPKGESKTAFIERVMNGFVEIMGLPDEPILIVTHGGVFDALIWNYKRRISDVQNCHLYEFAPTAEKKEFPWEIWHHYTAEDGRPLRKIVEIGT
ncbi:MAG: histidine phosphatase family protein [Bdellovibrionales bacterium]